LIALRPVGALVVVIAIVAGAVATAAVVAASPAISLVSASVAAVVSAIVSLLPVSALLAAELISLRRLTVVLLLGGRCGVGGF
jgi:hypothetical protein